MARAGQRVEPGGARRLLQARHGFEHQHATPGERASAAPGHPAAAGESTRRRAAPRSAHEDPTARRGRRSGERWCAARRARFRIVHSPAEACSSWNARAAALSSAARGSHRDAGAARPGLPRGPARRTDGSACAGLPPPRYRTAPSPSPGPRKGAPPCELPRLRNRGEARPAAQSSAWTHARRSYPTCTSTPADSSGRRYRSSRSPRARSHCHKARRNRHNRRARWHHTG